MANLLIFTSLDKSAGVCQPFCAPGHVISRVVDAEAQQRAQIEAQLEDDDTVRDV